MFGDSTSALVSRVLYVVIYEKRLKFQFAELCSTKQRYAEFFKENLGSQYYGLKSTVYFVIFYSCTSFYTEYSHMLIYNIYMHDKWFLFAWYWISFLYRLNIWIRWYSVLIIKYNDFLHYKSSSWNLLKVNYQYNWCWLSWK